MKNSLHLDLLTIILQRCVILLTLMMLLGINLDGAAKLRDGAAYLNIACGFEWGSFKNVPIEDTQYFLGYPFLLSFFTRFLSDGLSVYLFQFFCLSGSLLLGSKLFEDRRIMQWLSLGLPSYVLFTSLNLSEALIMTETLAVLYFIYRRKYAWGALVMGLALITRPQTTLILYALVLWRILRHERSKTLLMILVPSAFFAGMHLFSAVTFGDPFHNYRLYSAHEGAGKMLALPFFTLIKNSANAGFRSINVLYIWFNTLLAGIGLLLLCLRSRKESLNWVERTLFHWGALQFLFLMSLGSRWAFLELPRYYIPVLPAALLGYQPYLPKKPWLLAAAALFCTAFAIYAEASGNKYVP